MKTKHVLRWRLGLVLVGLLATLPTLQAQRGDNPPPLLTEADQKWAELQALFTPPVPGELPVATDEESRVRARRWIADRFLQAAAAAKAFAAEYPESAHAREAVRLEGKNILQAAMAGDVSQEARGREILKDIRGENTLPAKDRFELVALSELVRLRPLFPDRDRFLPAYEESIRNQIIEFPKETAPYESLLRFAENLPDEAETRRIAQEIAERMPAPTGVKAAAGEALTKLDLVGQSLAALLRGAAGWADDEVSSRKGGIVLYTWSAQSPGSMAAAKNIAQRLPPTVQIIGVNLDTDVATAKAAAASEQLPGQQFYDDRGLDGPIAQALKLRRLGEVYVADATGTIRSVSAQRGDLSAKMGFATP